MNIHEIRALVIRLHQEELRHKRATARIIKDAHEKGVMVAPKGKLDYLLNEIEDLEDVVKFIKEIDNPERLVDMLRKNL